MIDYQAIVGELDDEKVKKILDDFNIPYIDKGAYILMPTICYHV